VPDWESIAWIGKRFYGIRILFIHHKWRHLRSGHQLTRVYFERDVIARDEGDIRIVAVVFVGYSGYLLLLIIVFRGLITEFGFFDGGKLEDIS